MLMMHWGGKWQEEPYFIEKQTLESEPYLILMCFIYPELPVLWMQLTSWNQKQTYRGQASVSLALEVDQGFETLDIVWQYIG